MGPLAGSGSRALCGAALLVASLGGAVLVSAQPAGAATTSVTLYVAKSGTQVKGCLGPGATACKTIQDGITAAETGYSGLNITVTVGPGTYTTHTVLITAPASSIASLMIQGAGASTTTVTANNLGRGFTIASGTVTIAGLTITKGMATTTAPTHSGGGALVGRTAKATFTNDTFSTDTAMHYGGGVYNRGTAIFTNDTFSDDTAGTTGGGVTNTGGTTTLTNDTFWTDTAKFGGGISNYFATAALTDDTFSGDTATSGGAVENTQGQATITASLISNSSCFSSGGAGLSGNHNVTNKASCALGSTTMLATTLDLTTTLMPDSSTGPETLAIGPTSPALNEVPQAVCANVTTDERGKPRPGDTTGTDLQTRCDAGAYELQHSITTLSQGTPKTGSTPSGTATTFQLAVTGTGATTGTVSFSATTGSVPSGVTVSATGTITVPASTTTGAYTLLGTDSDPLGDSGTWAFALHVTGGLADLKVTATGPASVVSGVSFTDTITVTDSGGPSATTVTAAVTLDPSLHFDSVSSASGTCTRTTSSKPRTKGGTVSCTLGTLSAGESVTIGVTETSTKPGTVTDTATATATNITPADTDNTATVTATVTAR